jgi:hypothetical protein
MPCALRRCGLKPTARRSSAAASVLLAEPVGADHGLINAIVPQSELMAHAMSTAAALAAKPQAVLLPTRRLMRGDFDPKRKVAATDSVSRIDVKRT